MRTKGLCDGGRLLGWKLVAMGFILLEANHDERHYDVSGAQEQKTLRVSQLDFFRPDDAVSYGRSSVS